MAATVKYQGATTYVTYANNSYLLRGNDHIIIQPGHIGAISAYAGNDTVDGSSGADQIFGSGGNDVLYGGNGADDLYGDDGHDYLSGGTDNANDTLRGGVGDDTLYGYGGFDRLLGDSGNDYLNGGSFNDTVYGGAGADFLDVDSGWDFVCGGDGDDTYRLAGGQKAGVWETTGAADKIVFSAIQYSDLDHARVGDDLWIAPGAEIAVGVFNTGFLIHDYYVGGTNSVEQLVGSDGVVHALSDFFLT